MNLDNFGKFEWMKFYNPKIDTIEEDVLEVPRIGDTIRTKKAQMEGKVVKMEGRNVFFKLADGRMMQTPITNVIVIQKLEDQDIELMELSNELLSKYKTAAGKSSKAADAVGDIKKGNKRFSGVIKATNKQFANDAKKHLKTNEGSMGGINRSHPAQDVSYEHVLDDDMNMDMEKERARRKASLDSSNVNRGPRVKPRTTFRQDDLPQIKALLNGKIKFDQLPIHLRMALYKGYPDLPTDGNLVLTPGFKKFLQQVVSSG